MPQPQTPNGSYPGGSKSRVNRAGDGVRAGAATGDDFHVIDQWRAAHRGVHDVYEYNVNSEGGRLLAGLYVEIQYRTLVQHAWATAVEIIGHITKSQPKFQEGDKRYEHAMALASEILARAYERRKG